MRFVSVVVFLLIGCDLTVNAGGTDASSCDGGQCSTTSGCNASTCSNGCCTAAGLCVAGNATDACGRAGEACSPCLAGATCSAQGQCIDTCVNATVVRTSQLAPLFAAKCVSMCHEPGGVSMDYAHYGDAGVIQRVVGQTSLYAGSHMMLKKVDPNNLMNSSLWLKVSATGSVGRKGPRGEMTSARMPQPPDAPLTAAEVQQIKDWICTGAQP